MKRNNMLTESKKRSLYNSIMKSVAKTVKRTINEGYHTVVRNEDGEPIGFDYEPDQYEREEMEWEENELKAHDPMYAQYKETEEWYAKARRAFEREGVEVPDELVTIMAKKMRAIKLENDREKDIQELENYFKEFFETIEDLGYEYNIAYDDPTPEEYGHAYLDDIYKNGKELTKQEYKDLQNKLIKEYPGMDFPNLY